MKPFDVVNCILGKLSWLIETILRYLQIPLTERWQRGFQDRYHFHWRKGLKVKICETSVFFTDDDYKDLRDIADLAVLCDKAYDCNRSENEIFFKLPPLGWKECLPLLSMPEIPGVTKISGLQYRVWVNAERRLAAIVFRGTAELRDWYANARVVTRFIPNRVDHYDQVI